MRSLTCAASRNFSPPNFTKGMFRRTSSTSSGPLWCAVRKSTACAFSATPRSRSASTSPQTYSACAASSITVTSRGRSADLRSVHSSLANRSPASPITAFAAARMGAVER